MQIQGEVRFEDHHGARDSYNKPDELVNFPENDSNRQLTLW